MTIWLVTTIGRVNARLSQNFRRNISGSCPACLSCAPCAAWLSCGAWPVWSVMTGYSYQARSVAGDDGEFGGAHLPGVPEVQVQPVRARRRNLRVERDARPGLRPAIPRLALRVHVQVRQIPLPQRDQVPVRGEVGLQVGDRPAVAAHGQGELAGMAGPQRAAG